MTNNGGSVEMTPVGLSPQRLPSRSPQESVGSTGSVRKQATSRKTVTPQQPGPSGLQQATKTDSSPTPRPSSSVPKQAGKERPTSARSMYRQQANGLPGSVQLFQMGKKGGDSNSKDALTSSTTGMGKNYYKIDPFDEKRKLPKTAKPLMPVSSMTFPQYEKLKDKNKVDKAKANIAVGGQAAIAAARIKKAGEDQAKRKTNGLYTPSTAMVSATKPYRPFRSRNEEYHVRRLDDAPEETDCNGLLASKVMLATYMLAAPVIDIQPHACKGLLNVEDVLAEENELQELRPESVYTIAAPGGGLYTVPVPVSPGSSYHLRETFATPSAVISLPGSPVRKSTASSYHLQETFATPTPTLMSPYNLEPELGEGVMSETVLVVPTFAPNASEETVLGSVDRGVSAMQLYPPGMTETYGTQTSPMPLVGSTGSVRRGTANDRTGKGAPVIMESNGKMPVKNAIIAGSVIHAQNLNINYYTTPGAETGTVKTITSNRRARAIEDDFSSSSEDERKSNRSRRRKVNAGAAVVKHTRDSRKSREKVYSTPEVSEEEEKETGAAPPLSPSPKPLSPSPKPVVAAAALSSAASQRSTQKSASHQNTESSDDSDSTTDGSESEKGSLSQANSSLSNAGTAPGSALSNRAVSSETVSPVASATPEQHADGPLSPIDEESSITSASRSSGRSSGRSNEVPSAVAADTQSEKRVSSSSDSAISVTPQPSRKSAAAPTNQNPATPDDEEPEDSDSETDDDDDSDSGEDTRQAAAAPHAARDVSATPEPAADEKKPAGSSGTLESMSRTMQKFRYK